MKNTFGGHILLVILKVKKLLECFSKKELQKANKAGFRVGKIKKKGKKLYIKLKSYDNSSKNWIDKKDTV